MLVVMPDRSKRGVNPHLLQTSGDCCTPPSFPPQSLDDLTRLLIDHHHDCRLKSSTTVEKNTTVYLGMVGVYYFCRGNLRVKPRPGYLQYLYSTCPGTALYRTYTVTVQRWRAIAFTEGQHRPDPARISSDLWSRKRYSTFSSTIQYCILIKRFRRTLPYFYFCISISNYFFYYRARQLNVQHPHLGHDQRSVLCRNKR